MTDDAPDDRPSLRPGTITRVAQQKRDAERVSVYIDEEFAFGLALDLAIKAGLRKGRDLSVNEQRDLLLDEARLKAKAAALDYIAYKARTEQEVRQKLQKKGFADDIAEEAVVRMRELGYLDDADYARAYAQGRLSGRGHGPKRIRVDLRRRGVAPATIDAVLEDLTDPDELRETALRHGRKRWRRLRREDDPYKRRNKLAGYLQRRGFDFDLIREVTETLEAEDPV